MHTPLQTANDSMVATRMAGTRVMEEEELQTPSVAWSDPLGDTPFRMLAALGKGAAGEVVLVEHRALGTISVIKLLRTQVRGDQMAAHFQLEAQALSRIEHRNLVRVTGYDTTPQGRPYIVMEHLEGETLHARLTSAGGGPLPLEAGHLPTDKCPGFDYCKHIGNSAQATETPTSTEQTQQTIWRLAAQVLRPS